MAVMKATDDELLGIIVTLTQDKGYATVREVAELSGLKSTATVWNRVKRLRERGLLDEGRHLRATEVGMLMMSMAPEVLNYQLQVRIDPSSFEPVTVTLTKI